jgi:hypothetical protein
VKTLIPCELRDLDGTYLLVQPLDEIRCRVLTSNVAPKDEILYKAEHLTWSTASEDLGGFTRLGPAELLGSAGVDSAPDPHNLVEVLYNQQEVLGDHRRPDPEGDPVDPRTLPMLDGNLEAGDRRAEILRLAIHYRKDHERKDGKNRWVTLCSCPEFRMADRAANARLHALISMGLLKNWVPTLPRIFQAIHDAEGRSAQVA